MRLVLRPPITICRRAHLKSKAVIASFNTASGAVPAANSYLTIKQPQYAVLEVKKSKFFATAWPVTSSSQALEYVNTHKDQSASHNCFAYKSSHDSRSSDDGEPSGTAGQPILTAILSEQLDGVCVMVTRYFGGTKLGTGGLVRAYGQAARECLRLAEKTTYHRQVACSMQVPFSTLGPVYSLLHQHNAQERSEDYLTSAEVQITCCIAADAVPTLQQEMLDATQGAVKVVHADTQT